MGIIPFSEVESLQGIQRTITGFRRSHTTELTLDEIRLISEIVADVNVLLKRYSNALPGGF